MKNIELKVFVKDFNGIKRALKDCDASFKGRLIQVDTYYNCKTARLKIREINNREFELIFYQRPDTAGSKVSRYEVIKLSQDQARQFKIVLSKAYGRKVVVKKERNLWIYKNTRIHLDKVSRLGNFLELETVVKGNIKDSKKEYNTVVKLLKLAGYKKYKKSYSDMLLKV